MDSRSIIIAIVASLIMCAAIAAFVAYNMNASGPEGLSGNGENDTPGASTARGPGGPDRNPDRGGADGQQNNRGNAGNGRRGTPGDGSGSRTGSSTSSDRSRGADSDPAGEENGKQIIGIGGVTVSVEDGNHQPVPGAIVVLGSGKVTLSGKTSPTGVADFPKVPAGSYLIRLEAPEYPQLRAMKRVVVNPDVVEEALLVLRPLDVSISGRVLDSKGQVLEGIELRTRPLDRGDDEIPLTTAAPAEKVFTDEEGSFEITGLMSGEYILEAIPPAGFAPLQRNIIAPAGDIDLVLYNQIQLVFFGSVIDLDGQPVPEARVSATTLPESTYTDDQGEFRLDIKFKDSPNNTILMTAQKKGYMPARQAVQMNTISDTGEVEVTFKMEKIKDMATVLGRLVDEDGKAVVGERVYLRSAKFRALFNASSDSRGHFTITDVKAGNDYRLWVYPRRGYRDFVENTLAVNPGENQIEVVLEPIEEGNINVTLVDALDAPLSSFTVRLVSTQALANSLTVTSDNQGKFRVEGVPTGPLRVETRAMPKVTVHGITITSGQELSVTIPIGVGERTVEGLVTSTGGRPLAGARVIVSWSMSRDKLTSSLYQETVTDERGKFLVSGLGSGSCSVSVSASGHRSERSTLTVSRGVDPSPVRLSLQPLRK